MGQEAALRQNIVFGLGPETIESIPQGLDAEEYEALKKESLSLVGRLEPDFVITRAIFPSVRRPVVIASNADKRGYVVKTSIDGMCDREKLAYEFDVLNILSSSRLKNDHDAPTVPFPYVCDGKFLVESYFYGDDWGRFVLNGHKCWKEMAYKLGNHLRWVHREIPTLIGGNKRRYDATFPIPIFPIFDIDLFSRGIGPEFPLLLHAFQECQDEINALRDQWGCADFIHYDLRAQNILASRMGEICIVDWEVSGLGDGAFDLGMIIADGIRAEYEHRYHKQGFVSWKDYARSLIQGYCSYEPLSAPSVLHKAMKYAAVSLLVRASERLHSTGRLSKIDTLTLLTAQHLMKNSIRL